MSRNVVPEIRKEDNFKGLSSDVAISFGNFFLQFLRKTFFFWFENFFSANLPLHLWLIPCVCQDPNQSMKPSSPPPSSPRIRHLPFYFKHHLNFRHKRYNIILDETQYWWYDTKTVKNWEISVRNRIIKILFEPSWYLPIPYDANNTWQKHATVYKYIELFWYLTILGDAYMILKDTWQKHQGPISLFP